MRVLHTGDWHAGKTLYGFDRTPEIRAALEESLEVGLEHGAQAVLVAGDLFHTRNPGAEAEEAVYDFFRRAAQAGLPVVAVAGNHDSPRRLDAVAGFMRTKDIHIVGRPRKPREGGVVTIDVAGERMLVACLPFVSERVLLSSDELFAEEGASGLGTYQERVQRLMHAYTQEFRNDTINVMLMHGTMDGARLSGSEYQFHSGRDYAIDPNHVPDSVSYLAMGHVHMPQAVWGYPEDRARYCGSLVQLDFGEAGDEKRAHVVELKPGVPARTVAAVPLRCGRELRQERLTLAELEARSRELRAFAGHLKLVLRLEKHDPTVRERVRRDLPNARIVQVEVPRTPVEGVARDAAARSLRDNFEAFWREGHDGTLDEAVMRKFDELYAKVDAEEVSA
ncbi:MAG TPA: exonuclease SbcCD subunit D [Trueperaceae bacterium]|jgi:exonuclease SbcD